MKKKKIKSRFFRAFFKAGFEPKEIWKVWKECRKGYIGKAYMIAKEASPKGTEIKPDVYYEEDFDAYEICGFWVKSRRGTFYVTPSGFIITPPDSS